MARRPIFQLISFSANIRERFDMVKMPRLPAMPIALARTGRAVVAQTSLTRATPLGQVPPMPRQARKRMTNNCSGLAANHVSPVKAENQMMEIPRVRVRPIRSPSLPKM